MLKATRRKILPRFTNDLAVAEFLNKKRSLSFQYIVDLQERSLKPRFEILSRFDGFISQYTGKLFEFINKRDAVGRNFDVGLVKHLFERLNANGVLNKGGAEIAMNVTIPTVLDSERFYDVFMKEIKKNPQYSTKDFCLEINEHCPDLSGKFVSMGIFLGFKIARDDLCVEEMYKLRNFNGNVVKIDRGVVSRIEEKMYRRFIEDIVTIAKDRDWRVVAEGIETNDVAKKIAEFGVKYGQGYLWNRPQELESGEYQQPLFMFEKN